MMTACGPSMPRSSASIPASLDAPCDDLSTLDGATGAHVLPWAADTVHKYQLCAARVEALRAIYPKE